MEVWYLVPNVLFTADVHVSDHYIQQRPRLPVYEKLLDDIFTVAKFRQAQHIVVIGDLMHQKNKVPRDVYLLIYRWMVRCLNHSITVHYIRGNHESPSRHEPDRDCMMELYSEVCKVYIEPGILHIGGRKFVCLPYYPAVEFIGIVDGYLEQLGNKSEDCVLLAHVGLAEGSTSPSNFYPKQDVSVKDLKPDRWAAVLCGDYHASQKLARNVMYLGAPIPHTYGDFNIKGLWLMDTDTLKTVAIPPVGYPQFHQPVVTQMDGLNPFAGMDLEKDYIRCRVAPHLLEAVRGAYGTPDIDFLPLGAEGVATVDTSDSRISMEDAASPAKLVGRWMDHCKITDEAERESLAVVGLEFLK